MRDEGAGSTRVYFTSAFFSLKTPLCALYGGTRLPPDITMLLLQFDLRIIDFFSELVRLSTCSFQSELRKSQRLRERILRFKILD